jgi:hypothetical protein
MQIFRVEFLVPTGTNNVGSSVDCSPLFYFLLLYVLRTFAFLFPLFYVFLQKISAFFKVEVWKEVPSPRFQDPKRFLVLHLQKNPGKFRHKAGTHVTVLGPVWVPWKPSLICSRFRNLVPCLYAQFLVSSGIPNHPIIKELPTSTSSLRLWLSQNSF